MSGASNNYKECTVDFDTMDPITQLKHDLDDMDFPLNLAFENSGLMSSEFFDCVLSMEQNNFANELNNGPPSNVESDLGMSSDADEMRLADTCSPDSGTSSTDYEMKEFINFTNDNDETKFKSDVDLLKFSILPEEELVAKIEQPEDTPTKVFINNPNGKRVIVTKPFATRTNRKPIPNTKQVLRVQSISGKGRSVLLPFNVTKMKNIKIINGKELQAENIKVTNILDSTPTRNAYMSPIRKFSADSYNVSSPETYDDDSDSVDMKPDHNRQYPILVLTDEENRLLSKEGIRLPARYPLTKQEERELKRIRRKIRNKISAQDSRKRKKEYVDGLEERIKQGAEEKKILMNRVKHLQQQNNRLVAQMNKLQALVFNTSGSKATPTTCLLIVLASAFLVSLPNLRVPQNTTQWKDNQQIAAGRALLSSHQATSEDTVNMEEFLMFNRDDESELNGVLSEEDNNTGEFTISKYINSRDKKYDSVDQNILRNAHGKTTLEAGDIENDIRNTFTRVKNFLQQKPNDFKNSYDRNKLDPQHLLQKKYFEPDIDDFLPNPDDHGCSPPKKVKMETIEHVDCIPPSNLPTSIVSATVSVNSSEKE